MTQENVYKLLREISLPISKSEPSFKALPETFHPSATLSSLGLDIVTLPEILEELKDRLNGRDLKLQDILSPEQLNAMTIGDLTRRILDETRVGSRNPIVVYVDDEEENLFIFQRKFGRRLNLKTFVDPVEALEFIRTSPDVALVVTDEVMPRLSGNQLCDEVRKSKPNMKFILMTGNPNSDGDLMYRSLRQNRFFEFINKPVDFEGKGEDYFNMIQGLIHFAW